MENIQSVGTYEDFKKELGTELKRATNSFVKIGYLLRVAEDTEVLKESGYANVTEFAKAEYGLEKSQVSRFIAINERFSENGYSEKLDEKYTNYGYAKLTEILTLPDAIIESLSPDLTRSAIQEVKKEIKDEEQISDIEVMLEQRKEAAGNLNKLEQVLLQYFHDFKEEYLDMAAVISADSITEETKDAFMNVMAPSGVSARTVRIPGTGRILISIKGKHENIELVNVRTSEKEFYTIENVITRIQTIFGGKCEKSEWESLYDEPFEEKKPEVAPVQQVEDKKNADSDDKGDSQGEEAGNDDAPQTEQSQESEKKENQTVEECQDAKESVENGRDNDISTMGDRQTGIGQDDTEPKQEEQIPGQTKIEDFPETLPEGYEKPAEENTPVIVDGEYKEIMNPEGDLEDVQEWLITDLTMDEAITYITKFIMKGVKEYGKVKIVGKVQNKGLEHPEETY